MKRVFRNDIISLGLLYAYLFSDKKTTIISKESLDKFEETVESNLDNMKCVSPFIYGIRFEDQPIYILTKNETGEEYYCLKNNFDLIKAYYTYIESVPKEHIIASQMNNALRNIGLTKIDGRITSISLLEKSKKIIKK